MQNSEKAIFAMGCFWQPDYIFSKVKGVLKTRVGYTGCNSKYKDPTYEQVCSGTSECAEAIEITFDPKIITYNELLDLFWTNHDPTTLDRQGPDFGTQYRSAIFYLNDTQKKQIAVSMAKYESKLIDKGAKIVTQIAKASEFYAAEDYHQKYLEKTGRSCHISKRVFR